MNEPNERNQEANEGGQPTQTLPAGGQSSQGDLTSLQARLNEVLAEQAKTQQALKTMQGEANKGTKKVESRVTEIEKALRLKEKGFDDDEIMHRLKVDEIYNRGIDPEPVVQAPVATASRDTYLEEATRVVQESGLSDTDPEVVRLMVTHAKSDEYYKLALRKLKAPTPDSAGVPPMKPEGLAHSENNDELVAKLAEYQKKPTVYGKEIEETTKKLGW